MNEYIKSNELRHYNKINVHDIILSKNINELGIVLDFGNANLEQYI